MKVFARWVVLVMVSMLAVLSGSMGVASAEEDQTFEECISRNKDFAAYNQLMRDGVLDTDKYPVTGLDQNAKVEEAKQEYPEEFERLRKHYSEGSDGDDLGQRLGRSLGNGFDSMSCKVAQPLNKVGDQVNKAKSEFWEDPVGKFAKSVMEGSAEALSSVMTLWIDFGVGVEGSVLSQADAEKFAAGTSNIFWMVAAGAMVINVAIIGARLSWSRRQGLADGMEEAGEFAWTIGIYAGLLPAVIFGLLSGSDILAVKILQNFGPDDAAEFLAGNELKENFFGPVLMLLIAGFSFLGSVTQIVALAARLLIFPVMIGLLPLLAGSMATEWGKSALNSAKNWIIALLLYKPVAALIYVVAWWIAVNPGDDDGWQWAVLRALMVGIAGFSIIPLAKVLVPAIGSMGGSNTGVMGASGAAATGAIAGGAAGAAGAVARGVRGAVGGGASGAGRGSGGGNTGGAATGTGGRPDGGPSSGGTPSPPSTPSPSPSGSGASNTSAASTGAGSAPETKGASNNTASPGGRNAGAQPTNTGAGQAKTRQTSPTQTPQPANRGGGANLVSRVQRGMQGAGHLVSNASVVSNDSVGAEGHPGQVRR